MPVIILFFGVILFILGDRFLKLRRQYKIQFALCEHGVAGGRTRGLCLECKRKREIREAAQDNIAVQVRKVENFVISKTDFINRLDPRRFEIFVLICSEKWVTPQR